jgi:NAD/NADP transhydrogenase alpha subunit
VVKSDSAEQPVAVVPDVVPSYVSSVFDVPVQADVEARAWFADNANTEAGTSMCWSEVDLTR